MNSTPLLLVPLRLEARAVSRGAPGASIMQFGMGPARATAARSRILTNEPADRPIVLIGVAGGLVPGMTPGDVVVASSISNTESGESIALPHHEDIAALVRAGGLNVLVAPMISSPKIVTGAEGRQKAASGGAVAVDMESFWCAPLTSRHPFAVVRVLLDLPERELFSPHLAGTLRRSWTALSRSARAVAGWSPTTLDDEALLEVGDS